MKHKSIFNEFRGVYPDIMISNKKIRSAVEKTNQHDLYDMWAFLSDNIRTCAMILNLKNPFE